MSRLESSPEAVHSVGECFCGAKDPEYKGDKATEEYVQYVLSILELEKEEDFTKIVKENGGHPLIAEKFVNLFPDAEMLGED
jgi:hypothetical protein